MFPTILHFDWIKYKLLDVKTKIKIFKKKLLIQPNSGNKKIINGWIDPKSVPNTYLFCMSVYQLGFH